MKKSIFILILLLVCSNTPLLSQKGYLGRTRSVNFGVSSNFSIFPFSEDNENNVIFDENNLVYLPKFDLSYSIQSKRTVIDFETRYQMLPNAIHRDSYYEGNTNFELFIFDTIKMKTDNFRLGISLKSFSHVAPIGLYVRYGAGLNLLSMKLISGHYSEEISYSSETWETKQEFSKDRGFAVIPDLSLSIGKIIPLSRRLNLNFGVQTNFPLVPFTFKGSNAILEDSDYRKWLIGRSLFSRNIIEGYVKIHLFH